MRYGKTITLDRSYAETVARVRAALLEQGFGVLTEIDVTATMQAKLGKHIEDYLILGACNPPLAHQALTAEAELGALLPCNVVVYEREGRSEYQIAGLLFPNRGHGFANDPYMIRRRWDYFVRNLLGAEPPKDYELRSSR